MISANETQNGKHFRLFPVTETRNVALELGAGGAGRGGVGTAHEPATGAAHAGPQGGISRPRLLAVAALPWAGAWLLPSPRLSSPRLPREPEKRVRGDTRPAGETAFPDWKPGSRRYLHGRARGRAQRFPTPPGYFRGNRSLHRQSLLSHLGGPAIGTVTGRGGPALAFGAESTLAAGRGQGTSVTQRF